MTQLPNNSLDLAIFLYELLDHKTITNRICEGILPADHKFEVIKNHLETYDMLVAEDIQKNRIEFSLPKGFYVDFNEFLSAPSRRIKTPNNFYISDIKYYFTGDRLNAPELVKKYFQATELFTSLKSVAHEIPKGNDIELIFIQKEKIHLTSEYKEIHLKTLSDLSSFNRDFISSEIHKEQKSTIIKSAFVEQFSHQSLVHFYEIIENFNQLFHRINNSYQLYVSEFSFQKIKAEVEKEKLEFITKLNKVFSDIQNQLLAIPAALILIGGQMEKNGDWSPKNTLIWGGSLIFSILMNLLIRNQTHTLNAINSEINQQKIIIKTKHQIVEDRFIKIYDQLESRYIHQKRLISIIDLLVASCLIISTGLMIYYSTDKEIAYFSFFVSATALTYLVLSFILTHKLTQIFKRRSLLDEEANID